MPVTILGSSLYGAELAAKLGLPYGFASHFAPAELRSAIGLYRHEFIPSKDLAEPRVLAGVNVVVAETAAEADVLYAEVKRRRVATFLGRRLSPGRRVRKMS